MAAPILFVASDDEAVREALEADLSRRFGREYRVLATGSQAAGARLRDLAASSDDVAVVVASEALTGSSGVDFLVAAHELHPGARRVLLIDRGDFDSSHPAARAMTLGLVDHHLFNPWFPIEECLYLPLTESLAGWAASRAPVREALRIVGPRRDPRPRAGRPAGQRRDPPRRVRGGHRGRPRDPAPGRAGWIPAAGDHLPHRRGARGPVTRRADRGAGIQDHRRARVGVLRRRRGRRRPGRTRGRGLRRIRGAANGRRRVAAAGRPGRYELPYPQLPGLPGRHQRRWSGHPSVRAGVAVRHRVRRRPASDQPAGAGRRPRPPAYGRQRARGRRGRAGHGRVLAEARGPRSGGAGRRRGVLRVPGR